MRTRKLLSVPLVGVMTALFTLAMVGVAWADNLTNALTTGQADVALERLDVALSGGPVAVAVWLDQTNDSDPNCNLDGGDTANFNVASSNASIATVSPADFNVSACGSSNDVDLTVTPVAQGSADIQFTFDPSQSNVDSGESYVANTANFIVHVDDAPAVSSTSPADDASGVAVDATIAINFTESVNITNAAEWYSIVCGTSGSHTATTMGTGATRTLDPVADFAAGEQCVVTIVKNHVEDTDLVDGLNNMLTNHALDFTTAADTNGLPTVSTPAEDATGDEGSVLSTNGVFTDPDGDALAITKLSGDGAVALGVGGEWSWSYTSSDSAPNPDGSGTVVVQADDGNGGTVTDTFDWSAANVAPTADMHDEGPVDEGSPVTVSFSNEVDPSSADTTAGFRYAFDCDGGSLAGATYASSGTSASTTCTFPDGPATETVTGVIIDKDGGETGSSTDVTVDNVAPSITAASFATGATCSDGASLSITFTDPGQDTHVAYVDWNNDGDYLDANESIGTYTSGTAIPHIFATAGSHTVKVKVVDSDGAGSVTEPTATVWVDFNLSHILQPVNNTGHGALPSIFKFGSTIPVKVEVTDCDGSHPGNLVLKLSYSTNLSSTPPGEAEPASTSAADTGSYLRFSDPIYIYNLASRSVTSDSSSGVKLFVSLMDGSTVKQYVSAQIGFKK